MICIKRGFRLPCYSSFKKQQTFEEKNIRGNDAPQRPVAGADAPQQADRAATSEAVSVPASGSFSVAGVLVHAAAQRASEVAGEIARLPGALVHASAGGKLVVTLEALDNSAILETLTTIQRLPGVMSAALVSEQSEPLDTVDEELNDE